MKTQNKIIISLSTILILSASASGKNIEYDNLTRMEKHSLQLAKKFINGKDKSFYRPDGGVVFLHGGTMPSVLTAPLRLTDIQLQAGETIKEVQLGDTVRWQVSPSLSGNGDNLISHVIVKPTDIGLATTLDIFTDRRSYHINLKSTKKKYFPIVSFGYADELQKVWSDYKGKITAQKQANTLSYDGHQADIAHLDFNYEIIGRASWKPTRVFNDREKTYIVMPQTTINNEAPILLALDHSGKEKIVNYRVVDNRFIVDKIFDTAIMILGVGNSQQKITITRNDYNNVNVDNLNLLVQ